MDALVALVILSSALGLCLVATQNARKVAAQAAQTRQAEALSRYLLATRGGAVGVTSGRTANLVWRLEVKPLSSDPQSPQARLCDASTTVRVQGRGRTFSISTTVACQPGSAA